MFINNLFQSVFGQGSSNDQQTDINNNSTIFKGLTKDEESQIFSYADQKGKTYAEKKALVVDEYKRKLKEKYEIKRKQDRFEANTELEERSLTSNDPVTSQTYKSIGRNGEVAESIRDYVTAWGKSEADDWKSVWNDDKGVIGLYINKNPEQSGAINEYINGNGEQYDFIQQMHWDRTPESKSVQEKEAREKELNSYNIQDIINGSTGTWVDYATMPYRLVNGPILGISEGSFNVARRIWNNIGDIGRIVKGDKSLAEKFNQILLGEVIGDSIGGGIGDIFAGGIEGQFKGLTTGEQRQALSNEVSGFIQNLMESDLGQDTLNWWNNLSDEQKQEAKDYLSYLDGYLNLIGLKGGKAAKPALEKGLNKVAGSLEDVGSDIGGAIKNYQAGKAVKNLAENTAKANELAGRIVQGDIKAQGEAVNALKEIDTKGVKTYRDLGDRIGTKKKEIAKAVDKELAKDNTLYDGKTTRRVDMPDGSYQNLGQTPVHDAIKDLRELYSKLGDQEELLKLKYWEDKLNNEGLTKLEINNLAKQHGSEFSKKAFTEAGEPKWNDVGVKYETNRKAIKEYVRDLMPDDTTRNLDKMYHDLTDTEYYVKKMSEKVNTLTQKIKNRNLIEKFGAGLGDVINMVTGGGIKSFVTKFLPSNVGNKINNSLDMQRELPKLLERLDYINNKIDLAKSKKDVKEIADDLKETLGNSAREGQISEINTQKSLENTKNSEYNYTDLNSNQLTDGYNGTQGTRETEYGSNGGRDQGILEDSSMTNGGTSKGGNGTSQQLVRITDGDEMVKLSSDLQSRSSRGLFMEVHNADHYNKSINIVSPNKDAAIIVTPEKVGKNIGNFIKADDAPKGIGKDLMMQAIEEGGNKMDNFGRFLTKYYENFGFKPVARVKFNREYAPKGWNYARDGEPDLFVMMHNGDSPEAVKANYGTYKHMTDDELKSLPEMEYDDALAYRDDLIEFSNKTQKDLKTSEDVLKYSKANKDAILEQYREKKGNYVNPDDFRDFINDEDRLLASETQDGASWLAEQYFDKLIKENKNGKGLIIAGGPGGGKGTSIGKLGDEGVIDTKGAAIIVDKTKGTKELKKMLDNGMTVEWDVVVPNADGIVDNIIGRTVNQNVKKGFGKGRTLPINGYGIPTHKEVAQIAKDLYNESKNSKDFIVRFIDNTGKKEDINIKDGVEGIKLIEEFQGKLENITEGSVKKSVDEAYKKGDITKKQRDDMIKSITSILFVGGLLYGANEES